MVNRKIGNTEYKPISGYFYYPENEVITVNDDVDAYVSISKKLIDLNAFEYGYSYYQQIVNKYEKSLEWGIPMGILSVVFFVVYMIMNFKLPKTKPVEAIIANMKIKLLVAIASIVFSISFISFCTTI